MCFLSQRECMKCGQHSVTHRSPSSSSETLLFLPRHPTRPCGTGFWESSSHSQGQQVNSLTKWSGTHTHTHTQTHTHTHTGARTHTLKRLPAGIHKETTNEAERRNTERTHAGHLSLFPPLSLSLSLSLFLSLSLSLSLSFSFSPSLPLSLYFSAYISLIHTHTHTHTQTSITIYWIKNVDLQHASVHRRETEQMCVGVCVCMCVYGCVCLCVQASS